MLSWQCFLFNTLHIAFNCSGLIVYGKKSTQYNCHLFILNVIWLLYTPLIFPFFLIFSNFTVRYEDVSFYLFLLQFVNALESQHIFFYQFRNVFSHYLFKLCFFPFLSFVPFWDSNYIWFGPFITVHSCILTFFMYYQLFFLFLYALF